MAIPGTYTVAILTRAPRSGGKTRLFEALGCAPDPDLLEALFLDTLDATAIGGVSRVVFVTPPEETDGVRALVPPDVDVRPQADGDLGARMRGAFDVLLAEGAAGVVLIGSDLPLVSGDVLASACDALRATPARVVLGPALDGGYYLIGATMTPSPLFEIGGWGRADVLARTRARAQACGLGVVTVDALRDIDAPDDLRAVLQASRGAPRTRAWVLRSARHLLSPDRQ